MKDWQERVVEERKELAEKAKNLDRFLDSDTYDALDADERATLIVQAHAMMLYASALDVRIASFEN